MTRTTLLRTSTAALALFLAVGCGRRNTKVGQTPAPQKQEAPEYRSADPETYTIQEPDSRIKDLLVPVYFDFDMYNLRKDAISSLEKIAPLFRENPSLRLLAEGHADERGSSEYNMGLGERRSSAVKKWFVSFGIPADRIEITSYGRERPARPDCESEDCHVLNRRVEWKVIGQ